MTNSYKPPMERGLSRGCSFSCDLVPVGSLSRQNSIWSEVSNRADRPTRKDNNSKLNDYSLNQHNQQLNSVCSNKINVSGSANETNDSRWTNNRFHHMRWMVIVMSGLGMFLVMLGRLSITVAIIDMVNPARGPPRDPEARDLHKQLTNGTGLLATIEDALEEEPAGFDWDNTVQAFIISIYLVAYGIPQVPLSFLVERRGGHMIGCYTHLAGVVALAALPLVAHLGWEWVAVMRAVIGVAHSCILTIGVRMVGVWFPVSESNMAVSLLQTIGCSGVVFNPLISGYFTSINWVYAFYVPSLITLIWIIMWLVLVRDKPEDCWLVSKRELKMILSERNYCPPDVEQQSRKNPSTNDKFYDEEGVVINEKLAMAGVWSIVAKEPRLYAIILVWVFHVISGNCFLFSLPSFLLCNGIGASDISETGRWVFYVQLGTLVSFLWGGQAVSWLLGRQVSKTLARKIVYTVSVLLAALSWFLPSLVEDSAIWAAAINRLTHPVGDVIVIGTILDNFNKLGISASVFGIVNTVGNGSSFPANIVIGRILDIYGDNLANWHLIYAGFGLMNLLGLVVYWTVCNSESIELDDKSALQQANEWTKRIETNRNSKKDLESKLTNEGKPIKIRHSLGRMKAFDSPDPS